MSNIVVEAFPLKPGPVALVLIGHSNAGKTPLGMAIEQGWSKPSCRWFHFDFGHHLRRIWRREDDAGLSTAELAYLESVKHGRLIDDRHFPIVEKILAGFLLVKGFKPDSDRLVLNGLPRHTGQASGLSTMGVRVSAVVHLSCSVDVAFERKRAADARMGFEDRSQRNDNSFEIFCRRAATFEAETVPVLDFYANSGALLVEIPVRVDASPTEMLQLLAKKVLP